ncbi:MAG: sodium:glutamate symporter, partial [Verrucomicrobiae bacterium]|nr:sodium:glutamate symporter [Verrucomicrobiae bacterium]
MILSAWILVLLAIPVLLAGEWLVRRVAVLSRFNIPAPVVGGLLVSVVVLLANLSGAHIEFGQQVAARWWTWLVTIEPEWLHAPAKGVNLPFLVGFFTCIGLNASWTLAKRGSMQVLLFWALAGALGLLQNLLGVSLARALDTPPLLGLICGSVSMTGGHGTALGFAPDLEKAGLQGAAVFGVAAATFGLVAGGLLGGPVGGGLIRRNRLESTASLETHLQMGRTGVAGILNDLGRLAGFGASAAAHLLLTLVCVKLGAWGSFFIQQTGVTFPVYMGAMLLGVAVRNVADLLNPRWIRTELIDLIASVMLGLFLTIAMMGLNLRELASVALPMLVILCAQIALMALFAWFVTFRVMGRDFDAAVMAGGHCG